MNRRILKSVPRKRGKQIGTCTYKPNKIKYKLPAVPTRRGVARILGCFLEFL